MEALAIVPQLIILQRYREVENLTGHYVFLLGIYRALYIANWVYRSYNEPFYRHNWVAYGCAFVQTCLYLDFFYYYFQRYVILMFIYLVLCLYFVVNIVVEESFHFPTKVSHSMKDRCHSSSINVNLLPFLLFHFVVYK